MFIATVRLSLSNLRRQLTLKQCLLICGFRNKQQPKILTKNPEAKEINELIYNKLLIWYANQIELSQNKYTMCVCSLQASLNESKLKECILPEVYATSLRCVLSEVSSNCVVDLGMLLSFIRF